MKIIRLITVYTKKTIEDDIPEIGLYSTVNGSEFRWSEVPVDGYAALLTALGDKTTKLDLSNGGNIEQYNAISFNVVNLFQINILMEDQDFPVIGSKVVHIDYYPDASENQYKVVYVGVIDTFSADDRELNFGCEAWENAKNKNLSTKIIVGENGNFPQAPDGVKDQILPLCIGESNPESGVFFKIPCVKKVWKVLTQQNICDLIGCDPQYDNQPKDITSFPTIWMQLVSGEVVHRVRLGDVKLTGVTQQNLNNLVGKFIYVDKAPSYEYTGTDRNITDPETYEGESRKITAVSLVTGKTEGNYAQIEISIDNIDLYGNEDANSQYQSFVIFLDKGLDADNSSDPLYTWQTSGSNIGFRIGEQLCLGEDKKIMPRSGNSFFVYGNTIAVRPDEQFFPDKGNLGGYKIFTLPGTVSPIDNLTTLAFYMDTVFFDEGSPWNDLSFFYRKDSNYYVAGNYYPEFDVTVNTGLMSSNPANRDYTLNQYVSSTEITVSDETGPYIRAFRFPLPEIDCDFNELYVLVSVECNSKSNYPPMVGLKKRMGMSSWAIADLDAFQDNYKLDCIPSDFFSNYPESERDNFYLNGEWTGQTDFRWIRYSGYKNFICEDIDSPLKYKHYDHGIILLPRKTYPDNYTETLKIRQILIMAKLTGEIGDFLYV